MNKLITIWNTPTRTASTNSASKSSLEFSESTKASAVKTSSDMALVGPLIRCDDDPKIEATIVTTIAEYTPNRGSTPAISAYAMACGNEMAATVRPAMTSCRPLIRL